MKRQSWLCSSGIQADGVGGGDHECTAARYPMIYRIDCTISSPRAGALTKPLILVLIYSPAATINP